MNDSEQPEAEKIARANADAHRIDADLEDDEQVPDSEGGNVQQPQLDPDENEHGHDNDETAPTATRPRP